MDTSVEARAARANRRRSTWTIHHGEQGPPSAATASERVAMVFELSRDAWLCSGQPWPAYTRAQMPIVKVRRDG